MTVDHVFLGRLRLLSIVEGISTLVLFFVAMPLKYAADMPLAVTIAGMIHGFLFMGVVGMFNETNRLVFGYQVEPDEVFFNPPGPAPGASEE